MKTLSDIASELGVSLATVSYVYNGKWREKRIRAALAERILAALATADARPNALGKQLQSGRTQTVGVLLPHLEQAYMLSLLAGIEHRLGELNYMALLGCAHWQWTGRQSQLLARMIDRRVDGLLMDPRPSEDLLAFLDARKSRDTCPMVFIDNYIPDCPVGRVLSDNRWGAAEAVKALVAAGRRRIVFLGADPAVAALQDRYKGYCDALSMAGIARVPSRVIWRCGGEEAALDRLGRLLRGRTRPDAIFATSFLRFLPVLEIMKELGLRHPDDLHLAGFDEPLETWAEDTVRRTVAAPLLTVVQRADVIGKLAVDMLAAAMRGSDTADAEELVRPDLSWRSLDCETRRQAAALA